MTGEVIRLDIGALTRRLAVSRMSVSRMVKDGRLPAPAYLGEKRVWRLDEIEAWEAAHITSAPPPQVAERAARARSGKENPRGEARGQVAGTAEASVPRRKGARCEA